MDYITSSINDVRFIEEHRLREKKGVFLEEKNTAVLCASRHVTSSAGGFAAATIEG